MNTVRRYPAEVKDRAVQLVFEYEEAHYHRQEAPVELATLD